MAHSAWEFTAPYTTSMNASFLAVGTELTSGQITNRNAAWVSDRLSDLGLKTEIHITVADDRIAIRDALLVLETKSDFIFTCKNSGLNFHGIFIAKEDLGGAGEAASVQKTEFV